LINRELLLEEAIARGVRADERLVERAYDEMRSRSASDQAWRKSLARDGLTPETFRPSCGYNEPSRRCSQSQHGSAGASITDNEIREFYESNPRLFDTGEQREVAHILVRVPRQPMKRRKRQRFRKSSGSASESARGRFRGRGARRVRGSIKP